MSTPAIDMRCDATISADGLYRYSLSGTTTRSSAAAATGPCPTPTTNSCSNCPWPRSESRPHDRPEPKPEPAVDWVPGDPLYKPPREYSHEPPPDTVVEFDISRNPMFWSPRRRPDGEWSWLQGGAAA